MTTRGLRFFKLPHLILEEVIRHMEPVTIVNICATSNKSKLILRQWKSLFRKFTISIYFEENPCAMVVIHTNNLYKQVAEITSILYRNDADVDTNIQKYLVWMDSIIDMFLIKKTIKRITIKNWRGNMHTIFEWCFKPEFYVELFDLSMTHIKDDEFARMWEICNVTDALCIRTYPSREFKTLRVFNEKKLNFFDVSWLAPYNLLLLNCEELFLGHRYLTSNQVVDLLKYWLEGLALTKLKTGCLKGSNIVRDLVLNQFQTEILGRNDVESIYAKHERGKLDEIVQGGSLIRRADDARLLILTYPDNVHVNQIYMQVVK